ncbi:MBL fold metallo-hydrolase [Tumidithrix elongata RA019]|uniref:MBL fold metallo-hydrolase n=1 Tax=Tumidithrix elongata BACA0141 TaxID=2716417 RepID=A0AAW9PPR3_9CYAN|nr:MBL fold metallo-hydrolase [Tumidithrix elongata RA019]
MAELECLPLASGQQGEGVCLQVRLGPYWFLLDCGLTDLSPLFHTGLSSEGSSEGNVPWAGVFCSHAHSDHGRGLKELHAIAPDLPIYTSEVTSRLLPLAWADPALAPPEFCVPLAWRTEYQIQPNLSAKLLPSGHLPGAASLSLTYTAKDREYSILYTGDFFLSNSRLVESLRLEDFRGLSPDVLIIEGSYGTAKHPHRRSQENDLATKIIEAIATGYSVILPVSRIGIGQEILMLLRSHHQFTGKDIDIWVDAAIALGCDAYLDLLPYLPNSVRNFAQHQPLFWDKKVRPHVGRIESGQQLNREPCILLVDKHSDWTEWLDRWARPWLILLPEFQSRGSNFLNTSFPHASAKIDTYLLADHSDVAGTTQLIHNLKPQHIVFMHGSADYLADLANLDELSNRYHVHCPPSGKRLELAVGESFHGAIPPRSDRAALQPYEGELAELDSAVVLTLPAEITADSRWINFADTGLVEARWQGEELIIRGLTQRELLSGELSDAGNDNLRVCGNCQFYRGQRCLNLASPLSGLKVSRDGYCLAFEGIAENTE